MNSINASAAGRFKKLSSVIPKRSTSDDVEGVPSGTSEIF